MAPKDSEFNIEIARKRAQEKKSHVSFPQLKYPSKRDGVWKDSTQWLEGKIEDDGAEGLWRVHSSLYDLTDFIKKHPGGEEWIELTKGTDITEAFESHHLNTKLVTDRLNKYYVKDAKTPRNSPFTFEDDGFYRTFKKVVAEQLKEVPSYVSGYSNMIIDGLFITCLISSALSCWSKDYWTVMITYLIASVSLSWMVVGSHNYIHRKPNWRMYLFNLSLWSYRDFRVSHVLSHHLYPNTLMDLEVSSFEPIVYWNPREKSILAKFAILIEQFVFPFLFALNFLKRFFRNFQRKDFFSQHYRWHDGVGFLLPLWMWIVSGEALLSVLYSWFWILCTASYIFFSIASNAAHHHPTIFKDGDEVKDNTLDWGIHEIETVMDRKDINMSHFLVMTFFGNHTLHHLFPTLDHAVLSHLFPVLIKHCEKFRTKFRLSDCLDLFIGQIIQTLKTDPTLLKDK